MIPRCVLQTFYFKTVFCTVSKVLFLEFSPCCFQMKNLLQLNLRMSISSSPHTFQTWKVTSEQALPDTSGHKAALCHLHLDSEHCNTQTILQHSSLFQNASFGWTDRYAWNFHLYICCILCRPFTPSLRRWLDLRLFQGNAIAYPGTALHEHYFLKRQYENSCFKREIKYQFQVHTNPRKMKG